MTLTIDLAPETEAWISSQARQQGVLPADFARRILDERAAGSDDELMSRDPRTHVRSLLAQWQASDHTPILPPTEIKEGETPTQALFRKWREEDASMTTEEKEADAKLWEAYQQSINNERVESGMPPVF